MNAYELLELFHRNAIGLVADGDTLRCRAPKGFLTPELRAALAEHKQQLIAILTGQESGRSVELAPRPAGTEPLPLAFPQRQLWFLDQLAPGNPFYNNPAALGLHGDLDLPALRRSLTEVVRRHEALRTVFVDDDGEPRQLIRPAGPVPLPVTDLSGLPEAERNGQARAAAQADAHAPFDLAVGPLLRAAVLRLAPDEHHLLLNVHHIVADGWSIGILVQELATLYASYRNGEPSPLPEPAVQYPDYALWQRDRLSGEELRRQLGYWTERLAGAPTLLALPTDRPRPAVQRYSGSYHISTIGADTTDGLRMLAETEQASLFMVLTAALSVLLWRYSGTTDVCLGTPFANRDRAELEGLIGHFVNTVVLRSQIDPAQGFTGLLAEVRDQVLDAYGHPDLPLEQLVEALKPERHTSHSPLFQVMLVMQNLPKGRLELPGLTLQPLPTSTDAARFDLAVEATESPDGLALTFEYNTDLFDPTTIARLAEHFDRLLAGLVAEPARPVGELALLGPAERQRQLYDWNATVAHFDQAGLIERFAEQVAIRPDQLAVQDERAALSYAELDRQANRLAHGLIARGVRPDQVVGLHAGRSTALLVGILGILKAGAGYLPLDPSQPPDRLAAMVADAEPPLVLSDAANPPSGWFRLAELAADRTDSPRVEIHPENLGYLIYTSGSTGRPKGVAVTRRSVANLIDHWLDRLGPLPGRPAMLWSSIGFDVSVQEIFLPITSGGTLRLVPDELRADPVALLDWMRVHRIAQAYLPPAFVRWLDEAPEQRLAGLALQQLLVGVEPLPELGLHRIEQALPGLRVLNGYGPTEATNYATCYLDPQPLDRQCPIGRPLANTRVYLLDQNGEPVPIGVVGELYLGGEGLARGYYGQPGQTARRFVPDPFVAGQRIYRTGDLARFLPDGNLEFAERRDDQIKLRGYRIELGEIEAALRAEPDVRDAAVLVDRESVGEPRLVAGVSRGHAEPRLASEWRQILSRRLPGYMIPSLFVELPRLPQTANGKLDRSALLGRAQAEARLQVNQASPRDQVELTLYQLWRQLLLHPDIGISDNFFEIGGTSISAIKLAHAIEQEFGESLPVRDIMLYPTIEALGGRLRHGGSGQPPSNLIQFRAGTGRANVICVHPAGGTGFCYLALAKVLPDSYGVYGIQSPGVNPGEAFLPTVEAMAESYLRLTEQLQDGPVLLTGLSYGGLVAYEMGRLLAAAGHEQLSVVLLDTLGTDNVEDRRAIESVDLAEFRDKLVKFNGMYPGIDDRQIEQYFRIYNHNRLTMRDYPALPGQARLVLLQATANRDEEFLREVREFWARRSPGELAVRFTDRDHWELLESDEVWRVAALFQAELDRFTQPVLAESEA